MDSRSACIHGVLKVKVKYYIIRALLCWHENRFLSRTNGRIATKLAHDGLQLSVQPGCAQGQGQGQRSRDTGTFVLARKSLLLAGKWPDRHQTCTRWTSGQHASRVCSRSRSSSKVTWYGHFCAGTKIASSRGQMAGSPPNLHVTDSRSACIQNVLKVKVKVKGHVIRALLCWHENRLVLAVKLLDCHQTCSRWSPGKRGPNFGFAYLAGTVIRRQSAIVPLDTQLASSYSHLQTLFR